MNLVKLLGFVSRVFYYDLCSFITLISCSVTPTETHMRFHRDIGLHPGSLDQRIFNWSTLNPLFHLFEGSFSYIRPQLSEHFVSFSCRYVKFFPLAFALTRRFTSSLELFAYFTDAVTFPTQHFRWIDPQTYSYRTFLTFVVKPILPLQLPTKNDHKFPCCFVT